ncbi:MAG TPA: hypothetical protein VLT79_08265 [Gemmatimonadales bacterium]|nr:hypothetical protein [Gemmatimonadales bacterium]
MRLVPLLLLAVCVACDRPAEQKQDRQFAARVMEGLLAYPRSSLVNISTGTDAAQVTLTAPEPAAKVAEWYRQVLRLNGWDLQNDATGADGSMTIYAEKGRRPLWIMLRPDGPAATRYTLIGAELPKDTASTAVQRSGSSMSSNRIQRR